jgi:hypothetical protein
MHQLPDREKKEPFGDGDSKKLIQTKPHSIESWTGRSRNTTLNTPDSGSPLSSGIREKVEPLLGGDLGHVRVHTSPSAHQMAKSLQAKAFTHQNHIWLGPNQSPDDGELMVHEATHVVQQVGTPGLIQRRGETIESARSELSEATDQRSGTFGFSQDEMEARLSRTPPEGADTGGPTVEVSHATQSRLEEAETAGGETGAGPEGQGEGAERGEGEDAGGQRAKRAGGRGRGDGLGGRAANRGEPATAEPTETPGPASEYESLAAEAVAEYLDGNLSPERLEKLEPHTRELLDAVDLLGQRSVTAPETSALRGLEGEALQPGAQRTGYEQEPLWLRTVARIRDFASQAGGIVGIIGLACTVSGFILSLLIPPVGAFLLTVGRFCDLAALILDAIGFVLGALLTGYNLYRLKSATDPAERQRLLGMVRRDAMGTLMSAISVATAVAPGAARMLGRGAGRAGARVAGWAARVAAQPTRAGRAFATVGRLGRAAAGSRAVGALRGVGSAVGGALRRGGQRVSGRFHTFMGRSRNYGWRAAAINRFGAFSQRAGQWLSQRGLVRAAGQTRFGRWARREYGRNLDMARLLFSQSERAHHTFVGAQLRAHLVRAQSGGPLASAAAAQAALQTRLGQNFPEVNLADLSVRADPTTGNLVFVRPDDAAAQALVPGSQRNLGTFLENMRRDEARAVNDMITNNPGLSDAAIEQRLNERPNATTQWTENEIWAARTARTAGAPMTRVPKTPHHTLSVLDAPHVAYDPRYIQLANAPNVPSYRPFSTRAASGPANLEVPYVGRLNDANDYLTGARTFSGGVPLTPPPGGWPPNFFDSPAFYEQLRLGDPTPGNVGLNTGIWVNPYNPNQRILFSSHFVAAHGRRTGEEGARAIFGPQVEFAGRFEGEVGRTLVDRSASTYGRARVQYGEDWRDREQRIADWMLRRFRTGGGQGTGAAQARTPESPATDLTAGSGMLGGMLPELPAADFGMPGFGVDEMDALVPAGMEEESPAFPPMLGEAGGQTAAAEPPPTPVLYSPASLAIVREQRLAVSEAIEEVNQFITDAQQAEQGNRAARESAAELDERNAQQAEVAQAERATVAGEQNNLTQASGAQQTMVQENARASGEADRGQREGEGVQSEGQNVSVEPKPEEPQSRSWLERAWDATAGALWDNLVAPAVRAVKRKVNQVMQSINEFIMNMINQALGLDEIEAELNGGGQDIQNRQTSLTETDTGLQETEQQAVQEHQRNQQSVEQADANIADSQATQEKARTLLASLQEHDMVLEEEESTGVGYVTDFTSRYQPFFNAQEELGEAPADEEAVP